MRLHTMIQGPDHRAMAERDAQRLSRPYEQLQSKSPAEIWKDMFDEATSDLPVTQEKAIPIRQTLEPKNNYPSGQNDQDEYYRVNHATRHEQVHMNSQTERNINVGYRTNQFVPLELNDMPVTKIAIGGFQDNESDVRLGISELVPLPASKLPRVFVDENLNFLHMFFQGMKIFIGSDRFLNMIAARNYYHDEENTILDAVYELLTTGYHQSDTELMLFLKKVIRSTFSTPDGGTANGNTPVVAVLTNIWGFEYIESGMMCSEADLRMWLSMTNDKFKIVWFNAFKSTGVPEFAKDGVKVDLGGMNRLQVSTSNPIQSNQPVLPLKQIEFAEPKKHKRSGSRHRSRRVEQVRNDTGTLRKLFT